MPSTARKRIGQPKRGKFRLDQILQRQRNVDALKAIEYACDLDD